MDPSAFEYRASDFLNHVCELQEHTRTRLAKLSRASGEHVDALTTSELANLLFETVSDRIDTALRIYDEVRVIAGLPPRYQSFLDTLKLSDTGYRKLRAVLDDPANQEVD